MTFFTINLKYCEPLSNSERNYFIDKVNLIISCDNRFNILKSINLNQIEFYWCNNMNTNNGILGCFSQFHPNKLFLAQNKFYKEGLISTVIHELTHKYQYEKFGFLKYSSLNIPFIRELYLEKEARYLETLCDDTIDISKLR